jgi:excisionase family DNA binding protein
MARTSLPPAAKAAAAQRYLGPADAVDPLEPLVDAVQEALVHHVTLVPTSNGGTALCVEHLQVTISGGKAKKQEQPLAGLGDAIKHVVAEALASSLGAMTASGKQLRLALANRLLNIEMGQGLSVPEVPGLIELADQESDPLLKTADVAVLLGVSRPYVSMLCDSGKLGEVTKTEGGHRRVRQSAVDAYKAAQKRAHASAPSPREAAAEAGMYAFDDSAFVKAAKRVPAAPRRTQRTRTAKT